MIEYFKLALSRYSDFSGRSRRSEYWYFVLGQTLLIWGLMAVSALLGSMSEILGLVGLGAYMLLSFALIVPSLAVAVRRLHDLGKSGWYLLIGIIPLVGGIVLLVWLATEGEPVENEYGPDPKQTDDYSVSKNLVNDDLV